MIDRNKDYSEINSEREERAKPLHRTNASGLVCRITKAQINSIKEVIGDMEAMLGCGDDDSYWKRHIKNMKRFLMNNGFS